MYESRVTRGCKRQKKEGMHVGIDLSLTSPGLAIHLQESNEWFTYFYAQRKREQHKQFDHSKFHAIAFEECDLQNKKELMDRYTTIATDIVEAIKRHNNTQVGPPKIRMEGYAFEAQSSSVSKLHELGGILKYKLHEAGFEWEEVPPTRLKKWFTGSGLAKKETMYKSFLEKGYPDLLVSFELHKCKGVPNPVQDIVDACALAESWCRKRKK